MPDAIAKRFNKSATTNLPVYTASDERLLDSVMHTPGGPTLSRAGVRPGPGLEVTVDSAGNGTVSVAPGGGIITDPDGGGSFTFVVPNSVARVLGTRPAAGTTRIDELVLVVKNTEARPADGAREVQPQVVSGVAAASPVAPTIPTGALRLRRITVPATGAIALSNPAQRTAALGGVLHIGSQAERDGIAPLYDGLLIYREDLNPRIYEARVGGQWVQLLTKADIPLSPRVLQGVVTITPSAYDTWTARSVAFPTGFFSTDEAYGPVRLVSVSPDLSVNAGQGTLMTAGRITGGGTGASISIRRSVSTPSAVVWVAQQLPAAADLVTA